MSIYLSIYRSSLSINLYVYLFLFFSSIIYTLSSILYVSVIYGRRVWGTQYSPTTSAAPLGDRSTVVELRCGHDPHDRCILMMIVMMFDDSVGDGDDDDNDDCHLMMMMMMMLMMMVMVMMMMIMMMMIMMMIMYDDDVDDPLYYCRYEHRA